MARLTVDQTLERAALRVLSDSLTQEVDPQKVEDARLMIATIKARRVEQGKERQRAAWRKSKRKAAAAAAAEAKEAKASQKRIAEALASVKLTPEQQAIADARNAERLAARKAESDRVNALRLEQERSNAEIRAEAEAEKLRLDTDPAEEIRRQQERQERLLRLGSM